MLFNSEACLVCGAEACAGSKPGHIQDGPLVPLETQVSSTALGSQQRVAGSLNRNTVHVKQMTQTGICNLDRPRIGVDCEMKRVPASK